VRRYQAIIWFIYDKSSSWLGDSNGGIEIAEREVITRPHELIVVTLTSKIAQQRKGDVKFSKSGIVVSFAVDVLDEK